MYDWGSYAVRLGGSNPLLSNCHLLIFYKFHNINMSLLERITQDYKQAMRDRNELKKMTLNYILAQIKNKVIELQKDVEDSEIISIIRKEIKNGIETISFLEKANKLNDIEQERQKRILLEFYLPATMSLSDTKVIIEKIIIQNNITELSKQRWLVMKEIMANHRNQLDISLVNEVINEMIS